MRVIILVIFHQDSLLSFLNIVSHLLDQVKEKSIGHCSVKDSQPEKISGIG